MGNEPVRLPMSSKPVFAMDGFPSHLNYIFITPSEQIFRTPGPSTKPYKIALKFSNEKIKVKELLQKLMSENPKLRSLGKVNLADSENYVYDQEWTMKDVKNHLRVDYINGSEFYLTTKDKTKDISIIKDECLVEPYVTNYQNQRYPGQVQLHFELDNEKTVITTEAIYGEQYHGQKIIEAFVEELNSIYGTKVSQKDIRILRTKDTGVVITNETNIWQMPGIGNRSRIQVTFKDPNFRLPPINPAFNNRILVFDVDGYSYRDFNYEEFKHMTFENVYLQLFGKEAMTNQCLFGLRIANTIIAPSDKLKQLDYIYMVKNEKMFGSINLVGRVITEKVSFYHSLNKTLEKEPLFRIEEEFLTGGNILQHRQKIRQTLQQGQLIFQKEEDVEPIYYYTSPLKYSPQSTSQNHSPDQELPIFSYINRQVQSEPIMYKTPENIKNSWVYRYTHSLLKSLDRLAPYQGTVYRGINYDIQREVGQLITFKAFYSTSKEPKVAQNFAIQSHDGYDQKIEELRNKLGQNYVDHLQRNEVKYYCSENKYVLLHLKCKNGKCIEQFSSFSDQQEVLIEPYSTFRVNRKWIEKDHAILDLGIEFLMYELEEVEEPKQFDEGQTSFICWVDDKLQEGKFYSSKIVEQYLESTVFLQLSSTAQLEAWIQSNKELLLNPEATPIFISNMTRIENNRVDDLAGIKAIQLIRKLLPSREIPVCLYIGNKQLALQKLASHSIPLKAGYLEVTKDFNQLLTFIRLHANVVFATDLDILKGKSKVAKHIILQQTTEVSQHCQCCTM